MRKQRQSALVTVFFLETIITRSRASIWIHWPLANGCDSIVSFELSWAQPITFSQSFSICMGGNIEVNGSVLTEEGTYIDSLMASSGCDSIVTTVLTFTNPAIYEETAAICAGDSVLFGNNYYLLPGIYLDTWLPQTAVIPSFRLSFHGHSRSCRFNHLAYAEVVV